VLILQMKLGGGTGGGGEGSQLSCVISIVEAMWVGVSCPMQLHACCSAAMHGTQLQVLPSCTDGAAHTLAAQAALQQHHARSTLKSSRYLCPAHEAPVCTAEAHMMQPEGPPVVQHCSVAKGQYA
jgi:hypothetical protein